MQVTGIETLARSTNPYDVYQEGLLELLARLDKNRDWLRKEFEKVFGRQGSQEMLIDRSMFRESFPDSRHGTVAKIAPLKHAGGHGGGGSLNGWDKRMGNDFFKNPKMGVRVLQHWIEKEDIPPRILYVVYDKRIERGYWEESVRIMHK